MIKRKIDTAIKIVTFFLVISLLSLAVLYAYEYIQANKTVYVKVPENYISTVSSETGEDGGELRAPDDDYKTTLLSFVEKIDPLKLLAYSVSASNNEVYAELISLDSVAGEINKRFEVKTMFPGDTEEKYYCVRVDNSRKNTVKFKASVRDGYEKLAEVLKIKVELISADKVLYDGLLSETPILEADLAKYGAKDIYYKISAYLETSAGNEYMQKELVCDFIWWIEMGSSGSGGGGHIIKPDKIETDTTKSDVSESESDTSVSDDTTSDDTTSDNTSSDTDTSSESDEIVDTDGSQTSEIDSTSETGSDDEAVTDNGERSPQTSDTVITRLFIAIFAGILAILLIILLILLKLKNDDTERE